MKRFLFVTVAALSLVTGLASAETVERIVAKVNGDIITLTELEGEVQGMLERMSPAATPEEQEQRVAELRKTVLDSMIDNRLVLQVAAERGLRVPARFFR
jgi:peptidyl-prolyl cis-trans isomerase SurA